MIVLGLTGSIGMGKSTAGDMLKFLGVSVHDADMEVHALLAEGGGANEAVCTAFPYFSYPKIYDRKTKAGFRPINRKALGRVVFSDEAERTKLEQILHPLVQQAQMEFIRKNKGFGQDVVALDIPLLFETGAENRVDFTINVSAPYFIQKARVLGRAGMSQDKFSAILNRQMPDGEKCTRADFVVHTGLGRAYTMRQLKKIMHTIRVKDVEDEESIA